MDGVRAPAVDIQKQVCDVIPAAKYEEGGVGARGSEPELDDC